MHVGTDWRLKGHNPGASETQMETFGKRAKRCKTDDDVQN
jgi:hypothetical protein